MREIKFRAWHRGYEGGHLDRIEPSMIYDSKPGDCLRWQAEGQPVEVMEFTGLTDCNDSPIFEGDILICFINDSPIGNLDKIEFKDGAFILGYRQVSLLEWMTIPNDEYGSGLEVIGNIYQNYDLLTPTT